MDTDSISLRELIKKIDYNTTLIVPEVLEELNTLRVRYDIEANSIRTNIQGMNVVEHMINDLFNTNSKKQEIRRKLRNKKILNRNIIEVLNKKTPVYFKQELKSYNINTEDTNKIVTWYVSHHRNIYARNAERNAKKKSNEIAAAENRKQKANEKSWRSLQLERNARTEAKANAAERAENRKQKANEKSRRSLQLERNARTEAKANAAERAEIQCVTQILQERSRTNDDFGKACDIILSMEKETNTVLGMQNQKRIVSLEQYKTHIHDSRATKLKETQKVCSYCLKGTSGSLTFCKRCGTKCCNTCLTGVKATKLTEHLSVRKHMRIHLLNNNNQKHLKIHEGTGLYKGKHYPYFIKDGSEKVADSAQYKVCPLCWAYTELVNDTEREYAKLLGGGKKSKKNTLKKGKKVRKHQGIYQRGPKKGRLKPGFKYSGKKTKTCLKIIIKVKVKK